MIRVVLVVSLTALLALVLYLPSAYQAQHFIAQLRAEHAQLAAFWDSTRAERVLSRSVEAHATTAQRAPIPRAWDAPTTAGVNAAVVDEMNAVNARLFNNTYFRSVDALLLLASYRLLTMLEWLPLLAPFGLAATLDALIARSIKARQFEHHDPEAFAACAAGTVLLACITLVALVVPDTLPPLILPVMAIAMAVLIAGSLRNLHRRG